MSEHLATIRKNTIEAVGLTSGIARNAGSLPYILVGKRVLIMAPQGSPRMIYLCRTYCLQAAWGALNKDGTVLRIFHYELGVLLLPGLEAAYLASRHRGFSCTPEHPGVASTPAVAGRESGSSAGTSITRHIHVECLLACVQAAPYAGCGGCRRGGLMSLSG